MKPWMFMGSEMTSMDKFPEGTIGFVYQITNMTTNKFYIGKKNLIHTRTKALTKKELAEITDKRKSKKKKVVTESDWLTYCGSNDELKKDIKTYGSDCIRREILCLSSDKADLTYREVKYQFEYNVLEVDYTYNNNILGKFWRKTPK